MRLLHRTTDRSTVLALGASTLVTVAALIAAPLVGQAKAPAAPTSVNYYYPGAIVPSGYTRCPIAIINDLDNCIDNAAAGDSIYIAEGTYTESSELDKAVSLIGLDDGATLVAESGARVLTVTGSINSSTVISNLTFSGGSAPTSAGGGIYMNSGATPSLYSVVISGNSANDGGGLYAYHKITATNLRVINNSASNKGGGIYVQDAITINAGDLLSNTAGSDGGGLYAGGLFSNPSSLAGVSAQNNRSSTGTGGGAYLNGETTISGSSFVSNSASAGLGGGAFSNFTVTVSASRFESNSADMGGGLHAESTTYVDSTDFLSNTAVGNGGLSAITGFITGGTIAYNSATGTGPFQGRGGGIALSAGAITNTQIISNHAAQSGGGVYMSSGPTLDTSVLTNVIVLSNTAEVGGGLYLGGKIELHNSRITFNVATDEGGGLQLSNASEARISSNRFFDNRGNAEGGGGIYIAGSSVTLDNNFIAANVGVTTTHSAELGIGGPTPSTVHGSHNTFAARNSGGGLAIEIGKDAPDTVVLTNTILARYAQGVKAGPFASDVRLDGVLWDTIITQTSGSFITVTNPVTGNAIFVNVLTRNYHVQAGSAAVNAGVTSTLATDIDGQARPANSGYDIGADENAINGQPVANAGADQNVIVGRSVTLNGSASIDPEGEPLTYGWNQLNGPPVVLSNSSASAPTFNAPGAPTPYSLRFRLVVTDDLGLASVGDIITVTVSNNAPTANAGLDANVAGGAAVILRGNTSSDPDGHGLVYGWSQTGGLGVPLLGANSPSPSFTAPNANTALTFRLIVTDTYGLSSAPDTVVISVTVNSGLPTATPVSTATPTVVPQRSVYLPLMRRQ